LKAEEPSVSPEDFLLFWSYKTAYGNSFWLTYLYG
jgi:hypothetical protein